MENISTQDDDLLLNFIDGQLDAGKSKEVEERIRNSQALMSRFDELKRIHTAMMSASGLESPSRNFTQQVMARLDAYQAINVLSPRNGLLLLGGIVVAVSIALLLLKAGVFDTVNGSVAFDYIPVKQDWIKYQVPSVPVNAKRIVEAVLVIITGLSFVLLDRTILRPFFERRSGLHV